MGRQGSLFDTGGSTGAYGAPADIPARDPSVHPTEAPRLSRQCREILDRLRKGKASNKELATIALNYRARVSDIRAVGYEIVCVSHDRKSGLAVYELMEGESE